MFDLEIENLRLVFRNTSGHEHRLAPIAERAMAMVAERAGQPRRTGAGMPSPRLDLSSMGNEQAARLIADLCLERLALKL